MADRKSRDGLVLSWTAAYSLLFSFEKVTVKFVIRSQPFWPVGNGRHIVFRTND
jgi:hypothetical protein